MAVTKVEDGGRPGCPKCGFWMTVEQGIVVDMVTAHCSRCGHSVSASDVDGLRERLHQQYVERGKQKQSDAISNIFIYHPPKGDQVERYQHLRDAGKDLALLIERSCPSSMERDEAIKNLRQGIMWANAAIACNE